MLAPSALRAAAPRPRSSRPPPPLHRRPLPPQQQNAAAMTEEHQEQQEDVKPKINLVVDFEGQTCTVKVKPGTPFKKLFEASEKRFGKDPGTFKFTFSGVRLRPEETPAEVRAPLNRATHLSHFKTA
uniref:Ubiquitin-like protein SMT3 n=1 Tax=Ganoderma boninense TaxID=34458 RepID=A0A5K1JST3_9APHY|nr:Ubiquitin-like protein SMT3 [Ganoderma boninense]